MKIYRYPALIKLQKEAEKKAAEAAQKEIVEQETQDSYVGSEVQSVSSGSEGTEGTEEGETPAAASKARSKKNTKKV